MKAIEFQTKLHDGGIIEIPEAFQKQLSKEQDLRVIVLMEDGKQDMSWKQLTTKQFFEGYSDEDAVYDLKK